MDVVTSPHPRGEAGITSSLKHVREGAVEDRGDPLVREHAFKVLQAGGNPQDAVSKAQLLLTWMKQHFHYINDPVDLEFIASTRLTLCLGSENELCFRGGDCDDATRCMVALLLIVGIDAAVVHQEFTETDHVLAGFKDDRGAWHRIDPCYFDTIDGYHHQFVSEKWIDAMTGHVMCSGTGCPMNMNMPSDAVILKARPLGDYVGVSGVDGQLGDADPIEQILASWGTWLAAADSDMVNARDAAIAAHDQMVSIRASLNLPAVDTPASPNEVNPITPDPESLWLPNMQSAYEQIVSIATTAHQYAQEAIAGKRRAFWATDASGAGQIALEQLPGDTVQLSPSSTTGVAATDVATGQPLVGGFGQTSGIPLVIIAGAVLQTAIIVGSVYLITRQLCEAIETKQQAVVQKNLVDRTAALVASGKATAAEATAFVQAIGKASPVATASQQEAAKPSWSENLIEFGKLVLIGGGVIGGIGLLIWILDRYVPAKRGASVPLLGA